LPATVGSAYRVSDFDDARVLGTLSTWNHCLYDTGSDEVTCKTVLILIRQDVRLIGINSSSYNTNAADSFEHMVERMNAH